MAQPKVIVLPIDLINSEAFRSLNATALQVLFRFLTKRQFPKKEVRRKYRTPCILNNGEIVYSYVEAKNADGFHAPRFSQALKTLEERGFISTITQGGLMHQVTLYRVHLPDSEEPWRKWKK